MKKRILGFVLVTILCMTVLAGCGKKQCSICGETKSGTTKTILGEKVHVCNDCIEGLGALLNQ
jgi:hypothetical protein